MGWIQTTRADGTPGPTYDKSLIAQSLAKNMAIANDFGGDKGAWKAAGSPYKNHMGGNVFSNYANWVGNNSSPSVGGISAVNPQAGQANELDAFKRYEDMAYNTAMSRLDPAFTQQTSRFNQDMASRGIPVGSDAWKAAQAQMSQNQGDARQQAAFGAMQFGLGAQNQSFQQDHARSALANALLRAQMQKDVGMANVGLGYAGLSQADKHFGDKLGYDYDTFYDTLGQRNYEFDSTMDYNLWDRGNYWDFAYDRANASDYFDAYDRNFDSRRYDDSLFLSLFGQPAPGVAPQNAGGIYGQQIGNAVRPGFEFLAGLGF